MFEGLEGEALPIILILDEGDFKFPVGVYFLKVAKAAVSGKLHPFGEVHLVELLLILVKGRVTNPGSLSFAIVSKK